MVLPEFGFCFIKGKKAERKRGNHMRITDLLKRDAICLDAQPHTKNEAIDALVELQKKVGNIGDADVFKKEILRREESGSTAIGDGIAIPHAKSGSVLRPGLAAMTVLQGVDYESLDGAPTRLFFMIAAPEEGDLHLEVLSRLTVLLMDASFREELLSAQSEEDFLSMIDRREEQKLSQDKKPQGSSEKQKANHKILAVTACPTGIAHTYMAAEALEQSAKRLGCSFKAETNGSGGAKNVLTKKEIEEADGIIIAADRDVEMARFEGKRVLSVRVADGIHKPEELLQRVMEEDIPIYHHHSAENSSFAADSSEGFGRRTYKQLMNGVSHMLPFVTGGGILIALSFLLDDYSINPYNFGSNTPTAAFFNKLGQYAFNFMLPVLAGYIAMAIADRPGLAAGFVGGYIANLGMTFSHPEGEVSAGFLGALIAGFLAGYLVLGLKKLTEKLPQSLEGIRPVLIYPLAGILLIGIIMCIINPIMGAINTGITGLLRSMGSVSRTLLGLVLGGMMAIDMGGPFNKAAYVFGTAAIASQGYDIMAAVMIGGMVPPIAIALTATFFKNRFTGSERRSGPVNYIMGLCFITEGAIPFAAADPLRVIPSCIVGSAVAGALSMAFGCSLMAPHGGVFVFPVVGNVVWYIVALAAGSLVTMTLLALLKKPVPQE